MTTSTPRAAISAFSYSRGFLSNFWIQPIKLQVHGRDVVAPSAEHAFLGIKSERWEDAERILAAESPGYAMQISESVAAREDWNTIRIGAMDHVLRAKFAEGSELAQRLIDTGDATLRDGNLLNKTFWGAVRDPDGSWRGTNWLGALLMLRRSQLGWK